MQLIIAASCNVVFSTVLYEYCEVAIGEDEFMSMMSQIVGLALLSVAPPRRSVISLAGPPT